MGLKSAVKKVIPRTFLPSAMRVYNKAKSFTPYEYKKLPPDQYDTLPALKGRLSYNQYGGYFLPESSLHRPAAQFVMNSAVFEPDTINFMRENCAGGDIVHAGAYFGDFFPALSSACSAEARIWAFEPNEENFRCALITTLINKLENITLQNVGLGEKEETLYIRTKDESGHSLGGASCIAHKADYNPALDQEVRLVTIDAVIPETRNVSIIQFDVEGHEKSALAGSLETIRRCKPIIILEIVPECDLLTSDWFASNILELGYKKRGELHGINVIFSVEDKVPG